MSQPKTKNNQTHGSAGTSPLDPSELWEIHGKYYDLTPFLDKHPGGKRMLMLGKGKDCTELFESVHLFDRLPKGKMKQFEVGENPNYKAKFKRDKDGFYEILRSRVQEHFRNQAQDQGMGRSFETKIGHGTPGFVPRLLGLYILLAAASYGAIVAGSIAAALIWGPIAWTIGGYGHESLHGGVFSRPWKNRFLALFSMDIFGISSYVYSHIHNGTHHVYPNIVGVDPDIEIHYPLVREFSYQDRRWFHRFQFIYAWLIYAVSLVPVDVLDFVAVISGKWGNQKVRRPYFGELLLFFLLKTLHIGYIYLLPFYFLSPGNALGIIAAMLGTAGLITNVNFALNHQNLGAMGLPGGQNPEFNFEEPEDWGELQVRTAYDYQHGHVATDTLYAGLNYQIEHHLFPLLSYSKLPEIVPIVRQTCEEFGLKYYYHKTYWQALRDHYVFLREMGR